MNNSCKSRSWFESHVSLFGKPYTLDDDQAKAVFDDHKNTLVTARAGSGKTRVIVAKIAYLVATQQAKLSEIKAFMFNRTAAAEVNERIGAVEIDGASLKELNSGREIKVASTFHKFALDTVKLAGEKPELIPESEHDQIIRRAVSKILAQQGRKFSPQEQVETLRLASSFIARAGQKYSSEHGLKELCGEIDNYCHKYQDNEDYCSKIWLHRVCLAAYEDYLLALNFPKIDFNILMARATRILQANAKQENPTIKNVRHYKYIMVDEYQDFSLLFLNIIQALRSNCPAAHLFAVGDDWQAINRFAGSDVDYFINFAKYFPDDVINIPLMTNYRSDKRIVENANNYMLKNYNPQATRAVPFSKHSGKIKRLNCAKIKFDESDLREDALGDARYQKALAESCGGKPNEFREAAKLLKQVATLMKKHRKEQILLLHRHNFTSFAKVSLENFVQALKIYLLDQNIFTEEQFNAQVRAMTMHKSKGLESDIVILLELNRDQVLGQHPHATTFELFGDNLATEKADQHRLLYVAMTRAKHKLYVLTKDRKSVV